MLKSLSLGYAAPATALGYAAPAVALGYTGFGAAGDVEAVAENADGSIVYRRPDGTTFSVNGADAGPPAPIANNPDGTTTWKYPDGTTIVVKPNVAPPPTADAAKWKKRVPYIVGGSLFAVIATYAIFAKRSGGKKSRR
jgi:hypothetical protein